MKIITLLLMAVALFAATSAGSAPVAPPFKVTITAPVKPKVNVPWKYTVTVKDAKGKLVAARLSLVVIDPLGTAHPVEFYKKTTFVTNVAIKGVLRDTIIWPAASVGYPLKLQATVKAGGKTVKKTLALTVK